MKCINLVAIEDLFRALAFKGQALVTVGGRFGTLERVEREDGSGRSFNLGIRLNSGELINVYWRAA